MLCFSRKTSRNCLNEGLRTKVDFSGRVICAGNVQCTSHRLFLKKKKDRQGHPPFCTHTYMYRQFRALIWPYMHVFCSVGGNQATWREPTQARARTTGPPTHLSSDVHVFFEKQFILSKKQEASFKKIKIRKPDFTWSEHQYQPPRMAIPNSTPGHGRSPVVASLSRLKASGLGT